MLERPKTQSLGNLEDFCVYGPVGTIPIHSLGGSTDSLTIFTKSVASKLYTAKTKFVNWIVCYGRFVIMLKICFQPSFRSVVVIVFSSLI